MITANILSATQTTLSPKLFIIVFAIYVVGMIIVSLRISKKQNSGEDFLLGNRSVPLLLILGTTVATMVGTGSSMGAVGLGYKSGWLGAMYGIGGGLGVLVLAKFFGNVRKHNFMTMSEEVSFYYGANKVIKGFVGILILLASVGWLGAHIMGGSYILKYVGGIELNTAKIIMAFGFGAYVMIGGYMAVVWTDTIQAVILFFGFILMAIMAISKVGGLDSFMAIEAAKDFSFLSGGKLIPSLSMAFVIFIGTLGTPSYRQRIYSADSEKTIRKSFYLSGGLYVLFSFIPAIVGIVAFSTNPGLASKNETFPYLTVHVLPVSVGLIVLIAGLSATMSSASSDAITGVSILFRDIYSLFTGKMPPKAKMIKFSRLGILFITSLALAFTLASNDIIGYITGMIGTIMSGLVVCCFMGKYWSRATWQGGAAAILAGSVTSLLINNYTVLEMINGKETTITVWKDYWGNSSFPAVLVAIIAGIIISLITPKNTVTDEEAAAILEEERQQMEMH